MQSESQSVTNLQAIRMGLEHHQAGRLSEAEQIYQRVLELEPNNPDALHLLGVIANQVGKNEMSLQLIDKAIGNQPSNPLFLNNRGLALQELKRHDEALASYDKALKLNPDYAEAHNNRGAALIAVGRLSAAEASYRRALELKPDYVVAYSNLGNLLKGLGRLAEAEASYRRALELKPDYIGVHNDLGIVLKNLGRLAEAEASYRRALDLKPDYTEVYSNLGNVLQELGQLPEALASYRRALELKPDYPEAHNNLGAALIAVGRLSEAEASYRRALELQPDYIEAHSNLGNVLKEFGRLSEAEASCRRALELKPDYAVAYGNLGNVLKELGRLSEAEASYRRALELKPDYALACSNLGNVLNALGRLSEAQASCRRALELKPDLAEAHNNLGVALTAVGRLSEAEASCRRALALKPDYPEAHSNLAAAIGAVGRLSEAEASCRRALELKPDFPEAHSNLIFTLDMMERRDTSEQQAERRRWFDRFARRYAETIRPHGNLPDPERKLRVGYVSADFRLHSAYSIFGPILAAHDRAVVEVICYSGVKCEDHVTKKLRRIAQGWRSTLEMSDDALAAQIRSDAIDILVDLSGHSAGNRLLTFARRPAPVQVTAWGHATGTGLPTIDHFLADPVLVPPEERSLYVENVLDLPCCVCYEPPEYLPGVSVLPVLGGKPFTFGCFNRLEKISDRVIGLWSRILEALPQARLLIKAPALQDKALNADYSRRLQSAGIEPTRVALLGNSPHSDHLAAYGQVDLGLDPYPHGGGVSTLEALWMGVPVVTLNGSTAPGRLSASILTALQMQDWIAGSDEDYVRIALEAERDLPALGRLRRGLREHCERSVVGDVRRYTEAVESVYRTLWRRWCASAAPR